MTIGASDHNISITRRADSKSHSIKLDLVDAGSGPNQLKVTITKEARSTQIYCSAHLLNCILKIVK